MSEETRDGPGDRRIELMKLRLERARYRADILKWIVVALGAVVSFGVIDVGKLKLERFRATAENQRDLLNAYLKATEAPEPDVWKRKLHLLINVADDDRTKAWATDELDYIDRFAALDALYRETLKVAAQLVEPARLSDPSRVVARVRFNQLYWADLPFAGESDDVINAMITFRDGLLLAEQTDEADAWSRLNINLIALSRALRVSRPNSPLPRTGVAGR